MMQHYVIKLTILLDNYGSAQRLVLLLLSRKCCALH